MTDECSVEGCSEPIMTRGWCCTHYHRVIRHGTPAGSGRPIRGSVKQFILDNAGHTGDECLIWPFNRSSKHGYAVIRKEHFGSGMAHRSMCIVAHGPPPTDKHEAAHSCGKGHKGCVNPRHLSWKTPTENNRDRGVKECGTWRNSLASKLYAQSMVTNPQTTSLRSLVLHLKQSGAFAETKHGGGCDPTTGRFRSVPLRWNLSVS